MRTMFGIGRLLLLESLLIWWRIRDRFSLGKARRRDIWLREMLWIELGLDVSILRRLLRRGGGVVL
jgi:hypothetical protein